MSTDIYTIFNEIWDICVKSVWCCLPRENIYLKIWNLGNKEQIRWYQFCLKYFVTSSSYFTNMSLWQSWYKCFKCTKINLFFFHYIQLLLDTWYSWKNFKSLFPFYNQFVKKHCRSPPLRPRAVSTWLNKLRIEKRHHSTNMMHTLSQYFVSLVPDASVLENVKQNKPFV